MNAWGKSWSFSWGASWGRLRDLFEWFGRSRKGILVPKDQLRISVTKNSR